MADFLKNLEQHIENGWDDVKDAVKNDFSTLYDMDTDSLAAGIVRGMIHGDTLTSPVAGTIAATASTPGHLGLTFADGAGIVTSMPEDLQSGVRMLAVKGDAVVKGTPLMQFTPEALAKTTVDLVLPLKQKAPDGTTERIVRVYGPVEAE